MAVVTICSDYGAPQNKVCLYFHCFHIYLDEVMGSDARILVFWMLSFKPTFSLPSFTFIKGLFSFSLLSVIRVVSSAYLRLLIFLPEILILPCASSSPAFHTMFFAYKLNIKQGGNIQPWCTPFPIWNQSIVPCPVLTVSSWPAYKFLRRQVRYSGIPISLGIFQFVVIHTVKVFSVVNEAEVDVFLEFPCFLYDKVDVGSSTSGSYAFSKYSFYTWNFSVYVLLKPSLKDFEHYLASMWDERNCVVVWTFFGIALLWDWNETDLFQSCDHCWVFQICWHIECSTFIASCFRIWNSSARIPSVPLDLFIAIFPYSHLSSHSMMSD